MNATECKVDKLSVQKLLSAASGDAALLYLYIQSGNAPEKAESASGSVMTRSARQTPHMSTDIFRQTLLPYFRTL